MEVINVIWFIIRLLIALFLIYAVIRVFYITEFNFENSERFYFDEDTLEMKPVPLKNFFNKQDYMMKVFDVVKWNKPQNSIEDKDIMVVTDLFGAQAVQVTHLLDNSISVERSENMHYIAHTNSIDEAKKKYVK